MSVEEADAQNISMHNLKWKRPNQFLLWYDDESNYCGVYLDEPLVGCVFFLHHDEPIDIPCTANQIDIHSTRYTQTTQRQPMLTKYYNAVNAINTEKLSMLQMMIIM